MKPLKGIALKGIACLAALLLAAFPGHAATPWTKFTAILWHSDLPPAALAALPGLGITAGRVFGQREHFDAAALLKEVEPQRRAGLDTMLENVATDFYSAYHRWRPDRPLTAAFLDVLARYRENPADPLLWQRRPGLADPAALAIIERRLAAHARAMAGHPALYVSLGDETGIADLSAASDFDEGDAVLQAWRAALARRYGSLRALDRAWGSHHASWSELRPTRTDQALDGTGALAGWMDFKAWMDAGFARAVRRGTQAVHDGDPRARAAIEGVQLPGWGGYDYATLAPSVDVMEIGTVGVCFALARNFNQAATLLTTASAMDAADANRLWRSVLLGGSGVVLWDPDGEIMHPDGTPGPRGAAIAATLAGLHGPLGRRLLAGTPHRDPVGVLYSQASFRLRWLLDRKAERAKGQDWTRRDNDTDLADSPWRDALAGTETAIGHLGLHPVWIDEAALTQARLAGLRTILLPQSIVLDDHAIAALRRFAAGGGTILADTEPGLYDPLGTRRPTPPLAGIGRRLPFDTQALRAVLPPDASVTAPDGTPRDDVSLFRFDGGALLAIQRDRPGDVEPAILVVGGQRIPIMLDPAVPTILARHGREWRAWAGGG